MFHASALGGEKGQVVKTVQEMWARKLGLLGLLVQWWRCLSLGIAGLRQCTAVGAIFSGAPLRCARAFAERNLFFCSSFPTAAPWADLCRARIEYTDS